MAGLFMHVDHQRARSILCSAWKVVEEGPPIEVDEIWRLIWSGTTIHPPYILVCFLDWHESLREDSDSKDLGL